MRLQRLRELGHEVLAAVDGTVAAVGRRFGVNPRAVVARAGHHRNGGAGHVGVPKLSGDHKSVAGGAHVGPAGWVGYRPAPGRNPVRRGKPQPVGNPWLKAAGDAEIDVAGAEQHRRHVVIGGWVAGAVAGLKTVVEQRVAHGAPQLLGGGAGGWVGGLQEAGGHHLLGAPGVVVGGQLHVAARQQGAGAVPVALANHGAANQGNARQLGVGGGQQVAANVPVHAAGAHPAQGQAGAGLQGKVAADVEDVHGARVAGQGQGRGGVQHHVAREAVRASRQGLPAEAGQGNLTGLAVARGAGGPGIGQGRGHVAAAVGKGAAVGREGSGQGLRRARPAQHGRGGSALHGSAAQQAVAEGCAQGRRGGQGLLLRLGA